MPAPPTHREPTEPRPPAARWRSRCGRRALRRAASAALLLAVAGLAQGHSKLAGQDPAPDSTVAPPAQACVTFSGAVEPALTRLSVLDADGQQVNPAPSSLQAGAQPRVCVALPPLAAGRYEVRWVAVARDGHRSRGAYHFSVK